MVIRDAEVPGRLWRRFGIQGFIQGGGIREGLPFSVHHGRDRQFIQFFVGKLWNILFLLVQLPDNRQRLLPENRHSHFCQHHVL